MGITPLDHFKIIKLVSYSFMKALLYTSPVTLRIKGKKIFEKQKAKYSIIFTL